MAETVLTPPVVHDESPAQRWLREWRAGPNVSDFLVQAGPLAPAQIVAVLLVDQREHWHRGERILAETYLERHPEVRGDDEAAVELIYGEFLLREMLGETPTTAEYAARFPSHAGWLEKQFALYRMLQNEASSQHPANPTISEAEGVRSASFVEPASPGVPKVPGYELLSELGRGGMAVVYRARQFQPSRLVALKMLLAGGHAGGDQRARFQGETNAIARLQHPNIVGIFEVGFADNLPFFSMELVEDGSLSDTLAGRPQPPRQAAGPVEVLARAVHYAHERGVVHRDLKPANILLSFSRDAQRSADGVALRSEDSASRLNGAVPKIADFGLARLEQAGPTGLTASGDVLGTPCYMAPEQAAGAGHTVGPAADVWALGSIFYEMLAGLPPFRAATALETLEQIRTQEPLPPSRLQPRLPRDLETICLKCLAKEPARRYASAALLADDLGRFLAGRPILARPTPRWERAWKWACRRPLASASLTLAALALACLLGLWGWFTVRLGTERNRAEHNAEEREQQRLRAESNEDSAFEGIDHFLNHVADKQLAALPGLENVRRELFTEALKVSQAILQQEGSSLRARKQVAQAYQRCARIYKVLQNAEQERYHLEKAVALHRQLAAEFRDDPSHRHELAKDLQTLATLHFNARSPGWSELVEQAAGESIQLREGLVALDPDNDDYRAALANAWFFVAKVRRRQGQLDDAGKLYLKAHAAEEAIVKRHPDSVPYRKQLATTCHSLGILHYSRKELKEAERFWIQGRGVLESLAREPFPEPDIIQRLGSTNSNLGILYLATNRPEQAVKSGKGALDAHQQLARRHWSNPFYRADVASALSNLGMIFDRVGKPDEAERHYEAACQKYRELARDFPEYKHHNYLAKNCTNFSVVLLLHNKHSAAIAPCREAIDILTPLVSANPKEPELAVELARAHTTLANLLINTTDPLEPALELCEKAVQTLEGAVKTAKGLREATDFLGRACLLRGGILACLDRHAAALQSWERAKQLGHFNMAFWRLARAISLARLGKWTQSLRETEDIANGLRLPAENAEMCLVALAYAAGAEAIARDKTISPSEGLSREAVCEDRAVALLIRSIERKVEILPVDVSKWPLSARREVDGRLILPVAGSGRFAVLLARAHARAASKEQLAEKAASLERLATEELRYAQAQGYFQSAERCKQVREQADLKRLTGLDAILR